MTEQIIILYSFRRCPYAMRARMALKISGVSYEHREIVLRDKPAHMLELSPKGTVPVLSVGDRVIDESLDVMLWALEVNDPHNWLTDEADGKLALIAEADGGFKQRLDKYKYASRHGEGEGIKAREEAMVFLKILDDKLVTMPQLFGRDITIADIAIFPFVRQFANTDRAWFDDNGLDNLNAWLVGHETSKLFADIMQKHELWSDPKLVG